MGMRSQVLGLHAATPGCVVYLQNIRKSLCALETTSVVVLLVDAAARLGKGCLVSHCV